MNAFDPKSRFLGSRIALAFVFCLAVVFVAGPAAMAGNNPAVKTAVHVRAHNAKAGCNSGVEACEDINTTQGGFSIDAFPVFFNMTEYLGCEYGMTWPAWTYSAAFTSCSDLVVGSIVNPGEGAAHTWLSCQESDIAVPSFLWLYADGPGQIALSDHPIAGRIAALDCSDGIDETIRNYYAGVYGATGEDPCVVEVIPLAVDKVDDIDPCVEREGNITYTISYENPNPSEVTNVVIMDDLPLECNYVTSSDMGAYDAGEHRVTWNLGTLAASATGSVTLTVQVDASTPYEASLIDTCSIDSDETDPALDHEFTTVCAFSFSPLDLSKENDEVDCVFPGDEFAYTLYYENPNEQGVTGVVLTDELPAEVDYVSSTGGGVYDPGPPAMVTWFIDNLAAFESGDVSVSVQVKSETDQGIDITNNCQITSIETGATPADVETNICACLITGPTEVCPGSNHSWCGPDGMTSYAWQVTGNGAINGDPDLQCVSVDAGASCGAPFTIELEVEDDGIVSICELVVMVDDTEDPVITSCPDNIEVQCPDDVPAPDPGLVVATDNCDDDVTISPDGDVSDGGSCPEIITRTYRATDDCGNHTTCQQTITVHDTVDPVIVSCPDPITVCPGEVPPPDVGLVVATDNCTDTVTVTHEEDETDGGSCPEIITRTYLATDDCGNSTPCVQTITVDDTEAPVITTCPGNITVCPGQVPAPDVGLVVATDNCTDPVNIIHQGDATDGGSCPEIITRTYLATDDCGNSTPCVQTITVDDTEAPVITACPDPITVCPGSVPAPDIGLVAATDNCADPVTITHDGDVSDGGSCPEIITRTYLATDECGNSTPCVQTITVDDTEDPVLVSCAADIEVQCPDDVPAPDPGLVTATDNCADPVTVTWVEDVSDEADCPETIERVYKIADDCGNEIFCTQYITVNDTEDPVITSCPDHIAVQCSDDVPAPDSTLVTATDNCGSVVVVFGGDVSDGGSCPEIITRTYRAIDECNNFTTCTQTITVDDTEAPVIVDCPENIAVPCSADVPDPDVGLVSATDNCTAEVVITHDSDVSDGGNCPAIITRTYLATDECGNSTPCVQTITIHDTVPPEITCPADERVPCGTPIVFGEPTATDNCDGDPPINEVSTTSTPGPGPGEITHTRCWEAEDACGNLSMQCCQNIIEEACEYVPLSLGKNDDVGECVDRGTNITYDLLYQNGNDVEVTNVVLVDELPPEVNFVSATDGGVYAPGPHTVTWNLGTLAAQEDGSVELVVEVDVETPPLATVTNVCTIDSDETDPAEFALDSQVCDVIIPVYVDARPGECPNNMRLGSPFKIGIAVLGTADLDVTEIDPSSVRLTREGVAGSVSPVGWAYKDVGTPFMGTLCDCHALGGDGFTDLRFKFDIDDIEVVLEVHSGHTGEQVPLTLTGMLGGPLFEGEKIIGSDCVLVVTGLWGDERYSGLIGMLTNRGSAETTIHFSFYTKIDDRVTFEIFDVQGRLIQTLLDQPMAPGIYDVTWDGRNGGRRVPAGVYFARVRHSQASDTRKIVVVH